MSHKIGLWSDAVNFPSLPLMKLSSYYKARGCEVKLIDDFSERFDVAFCSKTFNLPAIKKIPQLARMPLADEVILGGTGFAIDVENGRESYGGSWRENFLDLEIEHSYPDYGLYPELAKDTAFGFLTRGCPNACGFCVVGKKEGLKSSPRGFLSDFWFGQPKIEIMDANLLACGEAPKMLDTLIQSGASINFRQGLDARYVDEGVARLLGSMNIGMAHFAFDQMRNEAAIIRGLTLFRKYFQKSDRHCKVFILTNYDTTPAEDWYRVQKVMELGFRPDIRIYQKGTQSQFLTDLGHWANNPRIYRSCKFADFIPRADGKRCGELYQSILTDGRR